MLVCIWHHVRSVILLDFIKHSLHYKYYCLKTRLSVIEIPSFLLIVYKHMFHIFICSINYVPACNGMEQFTLLPFKEPKL